MKIIYDRHGNIEISSFRLGIDGMDDATYKFLNKPLIKMELLKNEKVYHGLRLLNIKDGLKFLK